MSADSARDELKSTDAVSEEALKRAEKFVEEEEGAVNRLSGWFWYFIMGVALAMTLFHLYAAYDIVPAQILRPVHVGFALFLIYMMFPVSERFRNKVYFWDVLLAIASVATVWYLIQGGEDLADRSTLPYDIDVWFGTAFLILVLEAARRSTGPIMPVVAIVFLAYALFGPYLPAPWTHRGYEVDRLVGQLYITLEGIFGPAIDVSSSLIILFTIFGAILQASGAGKFFIDFSFSMMGGKPTSAGRAVTFSSFLLGGPSGSGVATTVTLGSIAWPMLKRAGYKAEDAGGLLAAGGLGAILSPPVLGAAAFLIAEFLGISYLDVIRMAVIPTVFYYLALFIMVELDAGRFGIHDVVVEKKQSLWAMTRTHGFHFTSLVSIVAFLIIGFSPVTAVFWSIVLAIAVSFLRKDSALYPRKLLLALANGSVATLSIAATCAAAGIIVGVVTLTGLGLKFSAIVIGYAGGNLALTALYTSLIVWIVGLAVPVTASYIICAVIAAPALIQLGVPDYAAHMFIFYYAVLSEVSPPTALSPFAAAAITGGDPYKTTLQSWKYTLPAFLVPFVFVLDPAGVGILLAMPESGSILDVVIVILTTGIGIAALASCAQNWFLRRLTGVERLALLLAGFLLLFPGILDAVSDAMNESHLIYAKIAGVAVFLGVVARHVMERRVSRAAG
ncbi:MAG: TRAP transporter fused permease subunit [Alphaproteobacteria bacterium]|nr:TRAP transporter fused permease subunit [Alphaproteobacteria bacterium]MBU0798603.1 TRAP transporter fused permease subunit [Alphaproteobacteria bacterium]MBU0889122.1 TRAP transporter fused permease subunit [Alphaproteobacteria bacterium]MBU1812156.1 TRAP transporter fused permease subunit [Alphaproteobacteria bacterium]